MKSTTFTYKDQDDIDIFVYKWEPDTGETKAVVQISHGVAEHALRYQYFAEYLTSKGYLIYANDHRGYGKSIKDGLVGYLGETGWEGTVKSVHELTNIIKKENPNLSIFFFGHSFGSLVGQDLLQQYGSDYKGVILSATTGSQNKILLKLGGILARRAAKKNPTKANQKLHNMNYDPFNKRWAKEPGATGNEWLSSDKEQVQKYIDDPLCGFVEPSSYFAQLIYGLGKIWRKSNEQKIPKTIPLFFIAGEFDPIGKETRLTTKLIKRYESYGIKDIEYKFYPNDRHETLNEVNKKEVYEDVANWLDKKA